jgi:threonine dehydrogenase-like Zn-dependent dehydrogenase
VLKQQPKKNGTKIANLSSGIFREEFSMKAIVFHGVGDIRLDTVAEPKIKDPTDAIIRITASAICGTDLHMIRGTLGGMKSGTILGHEAVGIIEEVGKEVKNLRPGDRVVVPSTIGCGSCNYCRDGYFAQCDVANPNGPQAGTAFYGGPKESGPFDGLQAEYARIPYANVGPVPLPPEISDDQAICLSDIFPTGYFGAKLAEIKDGNTVAVFGCGPVGQFAIASAKLLGASRVIAVDTIPSRLEMARKQQAEVIDFNVDDPVDTIRELTGGIGVDRVIDAVGVDAVMAKKGHAVPESEDKKSFAQEQKEIIEKSNPKGDLWVPGDAPSQVLRWAVEAVAKAGTLSIIGVYAEKSNFPIGMAMEKNLTIQMGNCNHRKYLPDLIEFVRKGTVDPLKILTQREPLMDALAAYEAFDTRQPGWIKVELLP